MQYLSRSMEKTFRRYQTRSNARHAFVEAEAATYLAHQIRVLRTQRGWSQKDLARRIGTTQAAVSRLEDPEYGRVTFKTMVSLAKAFNVAPVMKFVSTIALMRERWVIRREELEVAAFEVEAAAVQFYDPPSVGRPPIHVVSVGEQYQSVLFSSLRQPPNLPQVMALCAVSSASAQE